MLTKVSAYNPATNLATNLDPLVLNVINRPETDLFEVRNIDGLEAVKADINTTKLVTKKENYNSSSSGNRNIVMTLGLDPDWDEWTVSRLRRLLDRYFMPHSQTRLVFETMEFSPVEISGYIESNTPNMFSKDPEHQISIICPDPDFVSADPILIDGSTDMDPIDIEYAGSLDTGFVTVVNLVAPATSVITIRSDPDYPAFIMNPDDPLPLGDFIMSSIPGQKFAKVDDESFLSGLHPLSQWPVFRPGLNRFSTTAGGDVRDWHLAYYERFGSL